MVATKKIIADEITQLAFFTGWWRGCKTDEMRDARYEHFTVTQKYNFFYPKTGCYTQSVPRF